MRTHFVLPALLMLGCSLAVSAFSQETPKYDPIMVKRADLRLQWMRARHEGAKKEATESNKEIPSLRARFCKSDTEGNETTLVRAQGSPYLVDFLSLSGKRAGLRMDTVRHGLDSAFTDWLRRERPLAYQDYLSDIAQGKGN
jgi:hypothetical protein